MSNNDSQVDQVWSLIDEIKVAMVVTHSGSGDALRARPMATHIDADANTIYFLTDAYSRKDDEVAANSNVCLAFADVKGQKYVSLTGSARVSNDREKIRQLWSIADKAFWKDYNDPAIRLLVVEPEIAEYWKGAGMVLTYVKMISAGVTGVRAELNDNRQVRL
jgi:general stress protein 26